MAIELSPHLHKKVFENGLTLLVKETPGVNVATVQIWVKTGSVYEEANEAGITHLIEHMIFKGTPTRGPGGVARDIEELGGKINAYTSYEYTVYHATLSARHWAAAMEVLTDAIFHSSFDPEELAREKKVVLEEIRMRNDRPTIKLFQALMTEAYTTHPYRLPIIGTMESVSSFSRADILRYMDRHYHPEDFAVVVVGNVKVAEVVDKVKSLMADRPAGKQDQPVLPVEPPQRQAHLFLLEEEINQTHLALAFPISRFDNPDTPVLDVLTQILGQGETSRLYDQLRNNKGLVYRIDASAFTPRDAGLLEITATLDTDKVLPAISAALEEIFKLKYQSVSDEELERAKRYLESDFIFNQERVEGQAKVLGSFEFLAGDPRENDYLEKVQLVSRADIKRVANKYFTATSLTAGVLSPRGKRPALSKAGLQEMLAKAEKGAIESLPPSLIPEAYLTNVHTFKLPNGIRLLVREDRDIPTVAIRVVFPGGQMAETTDTNGASAFISEILPKGTKKLSAQEVAVKVADMAGNLSGFNGKNTFGVKAEFLSRFFPAGFELVRDIVITPAFNAEEAEKIRPELLAQIKQQEDSLPSLAFREFNRLLFKSHPYALNTLGSEAMIAQFTTEQLKTIYEKQARPDRMIITVAGDVNAEQVRDAAEKLFAGWAGTPIDSQLTESSFPPPKPPKKPELFTLSRDKEQVHIIIGFIGASLTSDDRWALEVLDTVLSGQSGRLFMELRDKKSLAYSLSSFSMLGLGTGSFGIYIGTSPEKKENAIKAVWQELSRIQEELISGEELQKAKNSLISEYEMGLQTRSSQALELALAEIYGLGQDFGNRYLREISAVTPEKVLEVARKYILMHQYVMVAVGGAVANAADAAGNRSPGE